MERKLVFYSLLDFYKKKDEIKKINKTLTLEEVKEYKSYVYSTCFEREYVKDLIWEYLNDWEESYDKLAREYTLKRRKQKNVIIKNILNDCDDSVIDRKYFEAIRIQNKWIHRNNYFINTILGIFNI